MPELQRAVDAFAGLMLPLSEKDLERYWKWKDHDEEGIRFAFFVTLQELRDLAVTVSAALPQPTRAQHILSQYHAAYVDLQAALFGLLPEDADRPPAQGEWSVRQSYAHILGAEINFTITIRYALEKHRAGIWTPEQVSEADDARLGGMDEQEFHRLLQSPLQVMREYHHTLHQIVLEEFSVITDPELERPSTFWEETRFPIRHRLHRFEAHIAQHTVQIDKTLVGIGHAPNESQRLLRKVYAALAEVEGLAIGVTQMDEAAILATASSISERTREIESSLN